MISKQTFKHPSTLAAPRAGAVVTRQPPRMQEGPTRHHLDAPCEIVLLIGAPGVKERLQMEHAKQRAHEQSRDFGFVVAVDDSASTRDLVRSTIASARQSHEQVQVLVLQCACEHKLNADAFRESLTGSEVWEMSTGQPRAPAPADPQPQGGAAVPQAPTPNASPGIPSLRSMLAGFGDSRARFATATDVHGPAPQGLLGALGDGIVQYVASSLAPKD